jgi:hypothetical protein
MSTTAFVLMNCDLVAVPLQVAAVGVVTVYCGARRANQLLKDQESVERRLSPEPTDCERMYPQSASGSKSSHRTEPSDSRSSKIQSSARNA